ncbi:MAG: hypothetical protein WC821_01305 [archaeon]|jgi:hypothetical protein
MLLSKFDKFLIVFFVLVLGIIFVSSAVNVDLSKPYHILQQISKSATDLTSIDSDSDGLIDLANSAVKVKCPDGNYKEAKDCNLAGSVINGITLPTCSGEAYLKWDNTQSKWICATISSSPITQNVPTKGIYTGFGQDTCAAGYTTLLKGYMYQGGQNNGYGGDFICSKDVDGGLFSSGTQGTIYLHNGANYNWVLAPPCVICAKDSSVGQCYTNWGDHSCATGFTSKYDGLIFGAGQNSGEWKTSLVCSESTSSSKIYRHINGGYNWTDPIECSVCCNDESGGVFTKWGEFKSTTTPTCPTGYDTLYSGNMFQSGQRNGYGANAVCGKTGSNTSLNSIYTYTGSSYSWGTVPCSVCSKTNSSSHCFVSWGGDLTTPPNGYSKIYSGKLFSGGIAAGDGGGLACATNGLSSAVYVYNPTEGYHWITGSCSLYCTDTGGVYTSWGSNTCANGYNSVSTGFMYQGGQSNGYGGEFKCAQGKQIEIYIKANLTAGYTWINAPACATCVKPSSQGECYTANGTQNCVSGYAPVYVGHLVTGGENSGYGQGTVCTSDTFIGPTTAYNYYDGSYQWDFSKPCAECCAN